MAPAALIRVPTQGWLRFQTPEEVLVARSVDEVASVLERLRAGLDSGRWAAGFFAYEATPAFDPAFAAHDPLPGVPVAWWGLFPPPERLAEPPAVDIADSVPPELYWTPLVARDEHAAAVAEVRRRIADGDTYQVNLTFPLVAALGDGFDRSRHPFHLFRRWLDGPAGLSGPTPPYAAWIDTATDEEPHGVALASASPELFFELRDGVLRARPMKGTAPRGRWPGEDELRRRELASEKNRAENLMIADMTRNDLGRVAVPGSVRVTKLFAVETYATVHQLTSEVTARLEQGLDALDVVRSLFPCASITGAPKARTSHIIRHLESHPRGVYTGSAGYFSPDGSAQLNVLIRTTLFDRVRGQARYGTGGGVVWDSRAESEYDEARAKTRVLHTAARAAEDFRLLETLLWRPRSGYYLLRRHLDRLAGSARFFGFPVDAQTIGERLARYAESWGERTRVRLLVDRRGEVEIQSVAEPCPGRYVFRLALDDRPVDESDVFLCHKTTHRGVYEAAAARHPEHDDVLLWNRRGELTETTRANLVLELDGRRLTPSRTSGLLAGTYREQLIADGRLEERVLRREDLMAAQKISLINSVRGWMPAKLEGKAEDRGAKPTVR